MEARWVLWDGDGVAVIQTIGRFDHVSPLNGVGAFDMCKCCRPQARIDCWIFLFTNSSLGRIWLTGASSPSIACVRYKVYTARCAVQGVKDDAELIRFVCRLQSVQFCVSLPAIRIRICAQHKFPNRPKHLRKLNAFSGVHITQLTDITFRAIARTSSPTPDRCSCNYMRMWTTKQFFPYTFPISSYFAGAPSAHTHMHTAILYRVTCILTFETRAVEMWFMASVQRTGELSDFATQTFELQNLHWHAIISAKIGSRIRDNEVRRHEKWLPMGRLGDANLFVATIDTRQSVFKSEKNSDLVLPPFRIECGQLSAIKSNAAVDHVICLVMPIKS